MVVLTFLRFIKREISPYVPRILFEFCRERFSRCKRILELTLAVVSLAFLCLQ